MSCLSMWLDSVKRKVKRILANQNYHSVKFYPHSILTINLGFGVAYEYEVAKFVRMWCIDENVKDVIADIRAIKEIFETENEDDMTWYAELISDKFINENLDRLISGVYARLLHRT